MNATLAASAGDSARDRLFVLLPPRADWPSAKTASSSLTLRWFSPSASALDTGVSTLADLPRAKSVWLLLDDRDVFSARLPVPRLSDAKLRLALPALLEEKTLIDPADSHVVWRRLGNTAGDAESVAVACVDHAFLRRIIDAFDAASVRLQGASSVAAVLQPMSDGVLSALSTPQRAVVRLDGEEAFGFALSDARASLDLLRSRLGTYRMRWLELAPPAEGIDLPVAADARSILALGDPATALNFLQGAFTPSHRYGPAGHWVAQIKSSGAWRAPAAWAAVCALIAIGGLNARWWTLTRHHAELRAQIQATFRDAFPGEPAIDEVAQASQGVARLRARAGQPSSQDFSVLQGRTAQLLAFAPVGAVSALDYDGQRVTVHLASSAGAGAQLENTLAARAPALGLRLSFGPEHTLQLDSADDATPGTSLPGGRQP